jgi:hypothetical protein
VLQWNAEEVAAQQQEPHVAISSDEDPDDVPLTTTRVLVLSLAAVFIYFKQTCI